MMSIMLQFFGVFLFCWMCYITCGVPTQPPLCTYPPGSIACKTWNYTNVDCAYRKLTCVPPLQQSAVIESLDLSQNQIISVPDYTFSGFQTLLRLDLSYNNISVINNQTFSGLSRLRYLDLSGNSVKIVNGSPFKDFRSLQKLIIQYGDTKSQLITATSFVGLTNLQSLEIYVFELENILNAPFAGLISLSDLTIREDTYGWPDTQCDTIDFTGLSNLKNLTVGALACFDICPLISLQKLVTVNKTSLRNECLKNIPLTTLEFWNMDEYDNSMIYESLYNLTSLSMNNQDPAVIEKLRFLPSPLQNLKIELQDVNMNCTFFKPMTLWNASLHVLYIDTFSLIINGSPFKQFSKLMSLSLRGFSISFNENAFAGLTNLQELDLNYIGFKYTNLLESGALRIFRKYNSLRVLNLVNSGIESSTVLDQACAISSLKRLDLSGNMFYIHDSKRTFPNLETLIIKEGDMVIEGLLCHIAPTLKTIDYEGLRAIFDDRIRCPYLEDMKLSNSWVSYKTFNLFKVEVPCLTQLHLTRLQVPGTGPDYLPMMGDKGLLTRFEAPQLKVLIVSSNQISVISKRDSKLLSKLTYLDLSDNLLTTVDGLRNLNNIVRLRLSGNKITTLPKWFFSVSTYPFLEIVDLAENLYVCDCNIMPFSKWVTGNRVVSLYNFEYYNLEHSNNYLCFLPDSRKGLSITSIDLDCKSYIWMYILIGIVSIITFIIISFVIALYHWNIKNRLYLLLRRQRDRVNYILDDDDDDDDDDQEDEDGIPRYDAYVTYHQQDEDWVADELEATIEGGQEPLRLCIRGRDIPANLPIYNAISRYMKRSRKVLVIMSRRYAADKNRCKFELNMAHQRLLEENENVLLLILLEDIPDELMTLRMRQLFRQVLCLKWPAGECEQNLFWRRLREEIKKRVPVDHHFEME